jgi:6-phosphogluconolactonase
VAVTPTYEVFPRDAYADGVAARISENLVPGPVMITGGNTAAAVYRALAVLEINWDAHQILFSDERAVPPTDEASNHRMAAETLLEPAGINDVLRIRGEDDPTAAALDYERAIHPALTRGIALQILGMGDDCHIAALFPGSPALRETERLVIAVDRPDGLRGITLTPPALKRAERTFVIVTGGGKAEAVARALRSDEPAETCPVHLLSGPHFLLDEDAASGL